MKGGAGEDPGLAAAIAESLDQAYAPLPELDAEHIPGYLVHLDKPRCSCLHESNSFYICRIRVINDRYEEKRMVKIKGAHH